MTDRLLAAAGRIETLSLDAGGVLVFPNWARVSAALAAHGVTVAAEALAAAEPYVKRQIDVPVTIDATNDAGRGWLYFQMLLERTGLSASRAATDALEELHAYHQRFNLWESVPPTVIPALREFRALGLRLVVVSNANGRLPALFERLGLSRYFDCLIDSQLEGVEKPDPRLFEIALSRAEARADLTLHVGDMYWVDVRGARAAGLSAVLLDAADLYPDADCPRVRTLAELAGRLVAARSPDAC